MKYFLVSPIQRLVLCCLVLIGMPFSAEAGTYYVDFVSGADSNSGTSTVNPWKHAPGMANCTASCASHSVLPGDRFIFKGGVTWDQSCFQMNITWSGSSAAPLYFGSDRTWFSGAAWTRPVFSGKHTALARGESIIYIRDQSWITIDNLEIRSLTARYNWGPACIAHYCTTQLVMSNLFIHDWALAANITTDDAHGGVIGNYPYCRPTGTKITHSVLSNTEARDAGRQNGVAVRLTDIEYSVIHDVQTAQLFGLVHDSEFYNVSYPGTQRGVPGSNLGFDPTPYHENTTYVADWDGSGIASVRAALVYNNVFHDIRTGSGAIYPNGGSTFFIFNNVVYNNFGNHAVAIDQYGGSSPCGSYHIWNNTFQLPSAGAAAVNLIRQVGRGITGALLDTRNNHYIMDGTEPVSIETGFNARVDGGNVLQSNSAASQQGYRVENGYAPTASTNATIGSGSNLSAECQTAGGALCSDTTFGGVRTAVPRPTAGAWDSGAYSATPPGWPPPAAPSSFRTAGP